MANTSESGSHVDFRLPSGVRQMVEQAAALRGLSLSDFAASTLVENAQRIVNEYQVTALTNRDRDVFLALLDDDQAQPNAALLATAESYKEWLRGIER